MSMYLKAFVGAIIAGLGAIAAALDDSAISGQEWVTTLIVTLTALGVVWAVPNEQPPA